MPDCKYGLYCTYMGRLEIDSVRRKRKYESERRRVSETRPACGFFQIMAVIWGLVVFPVGRGYIHIP